MVWHSFPVTIWRDIEGAASAPSEVPTLITIGNFDGVHRGHQALLARCRAAAGQPGLPVVAVTFDPHPYAVVSPDREPVRLTTVERRVELLRAAGADEVRVLAFDEEMAVWTPQEFIDRVIVDELDASVVVVGENFRFGARAAGDVAFLRGAGDRGGFAVDGMELDGGGEPYSSTRARDLISVGQLAEAAEVLGRCHEVSGVVVRGEQRGRALGFPTANVPVDDSYSVPPDGVYAGWLVRDGGERLPAAISVGSNPTFDGVDRRVESYVLDRTDLDLYGEAIRVEFVDRVRDMVAFDGVEALVAQMHDDVARTRGVLGLS